MRFQLLTHQPTPQLQAVLVTATSLDTLCPAWLLLLWARGGSRGHPARIGEGNVVCEMSGQASQQSPSGTWQGERKNLPGRAVVAGRKGRAERKGLFFTAEGCYLWGATWSASRNYLEKGRASKVTMFGALWSCCVHVPEQSSQGNSGKGRTNTLKTVLILVAQCWTLTGASPPRKGILGVLLNDASKMPGAGRAENGTLETSREGAEDDEKGSTGTVDVPTLRMLPAALPVSSSPEGCGRGSEEGGRDAPSSAARRNGTVGRRRDEGGGCDADLPCPGRRVRAGRVVTHQPCPGRSAGSKRKLPGGKFGTWKRKWVLGAACS